MLEIETYALGLEVKTLRRRIANINCQLPPLPEEVDYHIPVQKLPQEDDWGWLQNWHGTD